MALLPLFALVAAPALPEAQLAIAVAVASSARTLCSTVRPDGSEGPCMPRFALAGGNGVNGKSLAFDVTFTRGAIRKLTRDEFALLAGHEIAHSLLNHRRPSREAELAADRLGAELACRAGFGPRAGASLFRFLRPDRHHPPAAARRALVSSVPCPDH